MSADAVAAIDCGTNSTRLLVADGSGRPLERLMEITRLGQGVDQTGRLDHAAIDRTVAVLRRYREVMARHGVTRVRMTATSAARDAANRAEFFDAARDAVGSEPELLAGSEEGGLSFAGATADLDAATGPWLVADIGGGSTELAVGPAPGGDRRIPVAVRSLDIGCVRLTERVLRADPPAPGQLDEAAALVAGMLQDATAAAPELTGGRGLVGLAGTVAALSSLDVGLEAYDRSRLHHHWLGRDAVERLLATLAATDSEGRRQLPGMEAARADVIVGGTVVLAGILRHFDLDGCLSSEADILDGLVMTLVG